MARRAAAKQSPELKKEQNRINQRAFRKRLRKEIEDMRAQLASYEASQSHNPGTQPHETKTDHDIHELPPTLSEPWETVQPTDLPHALVEFPTQPSLESCMDNPLEAAATSGIVDPRVICNALATKHDATSEGRSEMFNSSQLPSESSIDSKNQFIQTDGYSYPQDLLFDGPGDVSLAAPVGRTGTAMYYPSPINAPDLLAGVTADFLNAQHSAFRSAEWYAKAAEVGMTVAKIRYNAWLADSSLGPQCSLDNTMISTPSSTGGVAGSESFANDLPSAATAPQPLGSLHTYNPSMSQVW